MHPAPNLGIKFRALHILSKCLKGVIYTPSPHMVQTIFKAGPMYLRLALNSVCSLGWPVTDPPTSWNCRHMSVCPVSCGKTQYKTQSFTC